MKKQRKIIEEFRRSEREDLNGEKPPPTRGHPCKATLVLQGVGREKKIKQSFRLRRFGMMHNWMTEISGKIHFINSCQKKN
ncbi:hypothetical protein AAHA92_14500 [Salvia divinorum]|uniref:Uncharacterized protein n=1 Tax=Salvia divinorum TaxID=28513 RepID=A0ABD1HBR5_SALDI